MALVVFMRGVNVGGHKAFKPAGLARELAEFDVVNVGAAGTFIVRRTITPARLRDEIARRLPFDAHVMICRGSDVLNLIADHGSMPAAGAERLTRYVTVMASRPRVSMRLPILRPEGRAWEVRVVAVAGRFALSEMRAGQRISIYPNEVIERTFGVAATTRNWNTIETICRILQGA